MESNWASEHLQTIRTLMERSAIYRRALAPVMLLAGALGIAAAAVACFRPIHSNREFAVFWLSVGVLGIIGAYLLVRRQALKDKEPFWTPPTRRITQALFPGFLAGCVAGLALATAGEALPRVAWWLAVGWLVVYGCALHAAGFFMLRGIRLFGAAFAGAGALLLLMGVLVSAWRSPQAAHWVMGAFFGVLHLAYGIYLYFTEPKAGA